MSVKSKADIRAEKLLPGNQDFTSITNDIAGVPELLLPQPKDESAVRQSPEAPAAEVGAPAAAGRRGVQLGQGVPVHVGRGGEVCSIVCAGKYLLIASVHSFICHL